MPAAKAFHLSPSERSLSFPLTRLLRSRPLPGGERYSKANAAT